MGTSKLEEELAFQIRVAGLPEPVREYRFLPQRRYRADFAWVDHRILVECEGGLWMRKSGHNTAQAIMRDMHKSNLAQVAGWIMLRFSADDIGSGLALDLLERVLKKQGE